MPITKSAKKALRQNIRRRARNRAVKDRIKTEIKKFRKVLAAKNRSEAEKQLSLAYRLLDKAARKGVLKKNAARRKKSQLARSLAGAK